MTTRDGIAERQHGFCWWCGKTLPGTYAIHHRKLRSQGGSDDPVNLVAVCHGCHNLGTHAIHLNPGIAAQRGFICRNGHDPAATPMTIHGGNVVRVNEDGTITTLSEKMTEGDW